MARFNSEPGGFSIQRFHCRGEHTYERGKPLEISASIEIGNTVDGEATVHIEVFRKKFWSYERIYSKRVRNATTDLFEPCVYMVCIPGYETEEFRQEQPLKMRISVTLNGESVFKEVLWNVQEDCSQGTK